MVSNYTRFGDPIEPLLQQQVFSGWSGYRYRAELDGDIYDKSDYRLIGTYVC